jgi:hypothetical protein
MEHRTVQRPGQYLERISQQHRQDTRGATRFGSPRLRRSRAHCRRGDRIVRSPSTGATIAHTGDANADSVTGTIEHSKMALLAWVIVPCPQHGELVRILGVRVAQRPRSANSSPGPIRFLYFAFTRRRFNLPGLPLLNQADSQIAQVSIERFGRYMSARTGASIQIEIIHLRAICDEIGDRLREILRRETGHTLPPRLNSLMQQLAKADCEPAPSIVPSLDDIVVEREVDGSGPNDRTFDAGAQTDVISSQ